jgi:hypothetical protein
LKKSPELNFCQWWDNRSQFGGNSFTPRTLPLISAFSDAIQPRIDSRRVRRVPTEEERGVLRCPTLPHSISMTTGDNHARCASLDTPMHRFG